MTTHTTKTSHTCPKCGSSEVVRIIYGLPSSELFEKAEAGKVVLGGCCISDDSPEWHCKKCEHEWEAVFTI